MTRSDQSLDYCFTQRLEMYAGTRCTCKDKLLLHGDGLRSSLRIIEIMRLVYLTLTVKEARLSSSIKKRFS